mmetsp:Transcript_60555/g.143182  ORF Transcript_60555/g.143182 Transcript_60555/m.143182 type:complete len:97 (-) Transcript_60555:40-330(-)|eukprot:CAMPEP_0175951622 /NCGR_PEP_ID=MMETSP0108-20121206/30302_1 /TAXON_ID=195067 ORGANISM="Goniomonas pacifica, Strain CCMP1869" /NCGR_SAMPLE_ID=MMETSP0108 /ASSEMBLY_ACC=CAM_ASM_000204 /LENGTH=96 /DNA_ID=CAMNT_0017277901 /DNA_START=414 /DNA_END=704 /DNA_ORIENTATION=-
MVFQLLLESLGVQFERLFPHQKLQLLLVFFYHTLQLLLAFFCKSAQHIFPIMRLLQIILQVPVARDHQAGNFVSVGLAVSAQLLNQEEDHQQRLGP